MGTWGTAILSNDLAADLNDQWKELLGEGYEPQDISQSMIESAKEDGLLDDIEDEYDFWLSFALIQWKSGRLQPDVKEKALDLLIGENIYQIEKDRWDDPIEFKKRISNIHKLKETLNSDQPVARKIRKAYKQTTILLKGDVITIKLQSGNYVILEIIEIDLSHNNQRPIALLYNYLSDVLPSIEVLNECSIIEFSLADMRFPKVKHTNFTLGSVTMKQNEPVERIIFLLRDGQPKIAPHTTCGLCWWTQIDTLLENWILRIN